MLLLGLGMRRTYETGEALARSCAEAQVVLGGDRTHDARQ